MVRQAHHERLNRTVLGQAVDRFCRELAHGAGVAVCWPDRQELRTAPGDALLAAADASERGHLIYATYHCTQPARVFIRYSN